MPVGADAKKSSRALRSLLEDGSSDTGNVSFTAWIRRAVPIEMTYDDQTGLSTSIRRDRAQPR